MALTRASYKASAAALFLPAVLLAAGCSSSSKNNGGGGASTSAPAGTPVNVTEKEYSIALATNTFTAGTYTFTVQNQGQFTHNLTIEGPGVDKAATPNLNAGASGAVTVTLQKGSYELWCSVDSHKDRGMDLHITVS
jgi:uncharacterized cupredoxin-like copper-binding protein